MFLLADEQCNTVTQGKVYVVWHIMDTVLKVYLPQCIINMCTYLKAVKWGQNDTNIDTDYTTL